MTTVTITFGVQSTHVTMFFPDSKGLLKPRGSVFSVIAGA